MLSPVSPPQKLSRFGSADRRRVVLQLTLSPPTPRSPSFTPVDNSILATNFTVLRKLGEGDFGIVKEVQCKSTSNKFAIKISKVDTLKVRNGLHYTRANLSEVRAHMSIPPHPHLIHLYRAWKEGGYVHMQLELCMESLDDYWREKNTISKEELHNVLRDSLRALKHLAIHNLVHLDVKPANILRSDKGQYKLADFSVTLDLNQHSTSDEIGSGLYAAPELLSNNLFTPKADIYSLAISLSQVSTPSDEPLTREEWREFKGGRMPDRMDDALKGDLGRKIRSMLRPHSTRPTADDLLTGDENDSDESFFELKWENTLHRAMSRQLSMSPSTGRQTRENVSPLVNVEKNASVIFHTDHRFFEMEKPSRARPSIGTRRPRQINFIDD
ncbi:hypothetical protein PRIPAC_70906 [Pristionchus pacificus]|uniref:non-specific serine/threonine protein kinase n=1 Tax=Pristionchus pacificus TaxID=54126 RepID=A0A2A6CGG9_PRIPA|nr:hypothetical protein PRIPAC_70906 [Pristionchus pacificus]|eukprot:PDM77163.1 protein kinase [Pristionchus pacificus]